MTTRGLTSPKNARLRAEVPVSDLRHLCSFSSRNKTLLYLWAMEI